MFSNTYKQKAAQAISLALPMMAGQLGQVLMGVFDNIQIGGLGADYIAACGFGNNVYWVINLLGMGVLFSVAPLVSEAFGEKNGWKAIGVLRSAVKVSLVVAVLFTALTYVAIFHLDIFQQDKVVQDHAFKYLRLLNLSTIALIFYTCGKQFTDGMKKTKVGMVLSLGGLLMNICLNFLLINGNWGFPRLGLEGAAIATASSRFAMAGCMFLYIWWDKDIRRLRTEYNEVGDKSRSFAPEIIKLGVPAGLMSFFEVAAFCFTQIMSGWLSVNSLASHQIVIGLASATFMVANGLSGAGTIMTGYAFGARDKEDVRLSGRVVFQLTIGIMSVFLLLFVALHKVLPLLFTTDPEVIRISATLFIFAALFQLSDGLQVAAGGALRGVQDVTFPSILSLITYWVIMVPLGYFLAFKTSLGVNGFWLAFIIGLSLSATLLLLRFRWKARRLKFTEL